LTDGVTRVLRASYYIRRGCIFTPRAYNYRVSIGIKKTFARRIFGSRMVAAKVKIILARDIATS